MKILVVDSDLTTHSGLVDCVEQSFPDALVREFTDPLLALKYGINHPVDVLVLQPQMRLPLMAGTLTETLREKNPGIQVVFASVTPMRRSADFDKPPDTVLRLPATPENFREALRRLPAAE